MRNRGIKYRESAKKISSEVLYPLNEAIEKVKDASFAKFDESFEVESVKAHANLHHEKKRDEEGKLLVGVAGLVQNHHQKDHSGRRAGDWDQQMIHCRNSTQHSLANCLRSRSSRTC